jgi:hypothetical protein
VAVQPAPFTNEGEPDELVRLVGMKIFIAPHPASSFSAEYDWRVMSFADVDAELKSFERALGGALRAKVDVDITEEEWSALIDRLVHELGRCESDDVVVPLAEAECLALRRRAAQARKALRYAGRLHSDGASPTKTALLPVPYARRIELLLGNGELPIAWLLRVDVLEF